jgi:chromosome condensin MukBEF MukE localization factor
MMAAIDRIAEAAHMLRYLEAANDFGALAARTLVAEAAGKIGAGVDHGSDSTSASVRHIDDRAALKYMRDVLVELARPDAQLEPPADL